MLTHPVGLPALKCLLSLLLTYMLLLLLCVLLHFRVIMSAESKPMRIIFPQSILYGWNPLSFQPANDLIKTAFYSGLIHQHLMNAVAFAFKEYSKEVIEKMQNRLLMVSGDALASLWIPDGDLDSVLGVAINVVCITIYDDLCDKSPEDETTIQMTVDALCRIPKLVHQHWQAHKKTVTDREKMATEVVEEFGISGVAIVDAVSRLLSLASIIARIKAGSDATYDWYGEEWIREAGAWHVKRDRKIADMTEEELLSQRVLAVGARLTVSESVVFSGVSVSRESLYHPLHKIALDTSGVHLRLMNDIFSYDSEMGTYEASENFVEYQRLFRTRSQNLDEALDRTIQRMNESMEEFVKAWKVMQTMDEDMKFLAMTSARHMFAHLAWAMKAPRYTRQKFVAERILLK